MRRCLLGVSDHASASTTSELVQTLENLGTEVKVIVTAGSKRFIAGHVRQAVDDEQEWYQWRQVGDEVLHIELTKWATSLLICPLSAACLAKLAHGLCDDLLTSVVRAWPSEKAAMLVPAMHVRMWRHPVTVKHFDAMAQRTNFQHVLADGSVNRVVNADLIAAQSGAQPLTADIVTAMQSQGFV